MEVHSLLRVAAKQTGCVIPNSIPPMIWDINNKKEN